MRKAKEDCLIPRKTAYYGNLRK